MANTLDSMPDHPLELESVLSMDDTYEWVMRQETDEVLAVVLFKNGNAHALGFDVDNGGWVHIATGNATEATEEEVREVEDAVKDWVRTTYIDEFKDGSVSIVSAGEREKNRKPFEVRRGLEPEYDCPDCDYYATGVTTSAHSYMDHLQDEHGYSRDEALDVLNG